MKKVVLGIILGFLLSIPFVAFADDIKTIVGKTIEGTFPVYVDGESLSVEAIVIEGTSYLPVRAISEKLGLEVGFENETIYLTQKESDEQVGILPELSINGNDPDIGNYESELEWLNAQIEIKERSLRNVTRPILTGDIETFPEDVAEQFYTSRSELEAELEEMYKRKAELENQ